MKRIGLAITLAAALTGLSGCGSKEIVGDRISGTTLTIYSSVPLHGASSVAGQSACTTRP